MTCRRVLDLIDAGPFGDYPAQHLEAAWSHAHGCPTCGPALRRSRVIAERLRGLEQPTVPRDVRSSVMARISRFERPDIGDVAPQPSAAGSLRAGWHVWISAACLTAGAVITAAALGGGATVWSYGSMRPTTQDLMASSPATLAGLTLGLVSYIVGLVVPLLGRRT